MCQYKTWELLEKLDIIVCIYIFYKCEKKPLVSFQGAINQTPIYRTMGGFASLKI